MGQQNPRRSDGEGHALEDALPREQFAVVPKGPDAKCAVAITLPRLPFEGHGRLCPGRNQLRNSMKERRRPEQR